MKKADGSPGATKIMGIVNVTPDSFFDGGRWLDQTAAIGHCFDLIAEGADLLDIGAESTRPDFGDVPGPVQIGRLLPVLEGIRGAGVPISVDTRDADVARDAIDAGATIVNDVSGGTHDRAMMALVAETGVDYICQLWRRDSEATGWEKAFDELLRRRDACLDAGIAEGRIILDPGLGFGRSLADDWQILSNVKALTELPHRVLIGASHKRFLQPGGVAHAAKKTEKPFADAADIAVTTWCAAHGVWAVRTHTVADHKKAVAVIARLMAESGQNFDIEEHKLEKT